jgi:hypothetical protein
MDKIKRKIYLDKIIKFMKNDFPIIKNLKDYGFYDQLSIQEMNYVFSGVFEQPVRVEGYGYESNGLGIFNQYGNNIYSEHSDGDWVKVEYDEDNNQIYWEDSDGIWEKNKYDENGKVIYEEYSNGYWYKYEYDENGRVIYYENSHGEIEIVDNK